jgi:hypothetical protein
MNAVSIGVAGTAKNTGKTTATVFLAECLRAKNHTVALTSIGYDGEPIDNLSGLPKPRHLAYPGDRIATAAQCLAQTAARIEILEETPCLTPLGPILIGKVTGEGLVTLVGPNKASDLAATIDRLARAGSQITLCDGALSRLAPLAVTDGLIVATGASRSTDFARLERETALLCSILNMPALDKATPWPHADRATLVDEAGRVIAQSALSSLLTKESAGRMWPPDGGFSRARLFVPGAVTAQALQELAARIAQRPRPLQLVVGNPLSMLMTRDLSDLAATLERLARLDFTLAARGAVPLLAMTVNPTYHAYDRDSGKYFFSSIDLARLKSAVAARNTVPVVDVVQDGPETLYEQIARMFWR